MKNRKITKSVFLTGLAIGLAVTGCGRKSAFNATPRAASDGTPQAQANESESEADLSLVQVTRDSASIRNIGGPNPDASAMSLKLVANDLIVHSEEFENPNSAPVRLWLKPVVTGFHFWGVCYVDRAQYQSDAAVRIVVTGGKLISDAIIAGEWGELEIGPHEKVQVAWVADGQWSWIRGQVAAPSYSCDEKAPQRGWDGFEFSGTAGEEARVSQANIEGTEATADLGFLSPERVRDLGDSTGTIAQHWGGGP